MQKLDDVNKLKRVVVAQCRQIEELTRKFNQVQRENTKLQSELRTLKRERNT